MTYRPNQGAIVAAIIVLVLCVVAVVVAVAVDGAAKATGEKSSQVRIDYVGTTGTGTNIYQLCLHGVGYYLIGESLTPIIAGGPSLCLEKSAP